LPLVSIVTPSLNQGRFIEETILSVKNQTYPRIEHIVIDGGSTDGTMDILKKYSDSLTWISEPDKGQSDAINKGWKMSKGVILGWLNSDDTYMPWAVETAVKFLVENPNVGMVYGDCNIIDEKGAKIGKVGTGEFDLGKLLRGFNMVPQPSVFLRSSLLEKIGYVDTNLYMAMDLDLWIRIGLEFNVAFVPELLANFRRYADTKTVSNTARFFPEIIAILDRTFGKTGLPDEIRAIKRDAYKDIHMLAFRTLLSQGHRRESLVHLDKAIVLQPSYMKNFFNPSFLLSFLAELFLSRRALEKVSRIKRWFRETLHPCKGKR